MKQRSNKHLNRKEIEKNYSFLSLQKRSNRWKSHTKNRTVQHQDFIINDNKSLNIEDNSNILVKNNILLETSQKPYK